MALSHVYVHGSLAEALKAAALKAVLRTARLAISTPNFVVLSFSHLHSAQLSV